jgi:dTDP-4-amino-4,6-dideoxygalactose transaminase
MTAEHIPLVDLSAQTRALQTEIDAALRPVFSGTHFILGPQVEEFERAFAAVVGCEHGIGVSSGLDALRLALQALEIGPGDEVIVPVNTYIATALAVSATGARPVLVDCDRASFNLDVNLLAAHLSPRVRAILPVHLAGQAADMDPILEFADRHGLWVIEAAAQAHGARYKGRPCGSLALMGCFSFYPCKNLGACGDAGMVTTRNAALAERLRLLRNYGQTGDHVHSQRGLNARLDTLQAAILNVKLPHLVRWNEHRARHAALYDELLAGISDVKTPERMPYTTHIYHLYVVRCRRRDALQAFLAERGIETGIHYPIPIHLQEAYADLGYQRGQFPIAEQLAGEILSMPMFPELREEQIERVARAIREFYLPRPAHAPTATETRETQSPR